MFSFAGICYLFLGGAGAGLSFVAGMAALSIPRECVQGPVPLAYRKLMGPAFAAASATLALAGLMLLADAGNPQALGSLFFAPRFNYMTLGAWAIAADVCVCCALALLWRAQALSGAVAGMRVLAVLAALVGLVVVLYTGLLLASMRSVMLWHTAWLPVLFLLSSLSCGAVGFTALATACGVAGEFAAFVRMLVRADVLIVALEAACAVLVVASALHPVLAGASAQASVASALQLMTGEYAWVWWGVFVLVGLVATAVLDMLLLHVGEGLPGRSWRVLGPLACVLAGAFALRFCLVEAGMHPLLG